MPEQPPLPLRDLHLPDPASWWPPAPGWWLLAALLILLPLVWWALRRQRRRRRPRYREAALIELAQIRARYRTEGDGRRATRDISALLKRVALQCFPAEQVASLSGQQWADFLGGNSSTPLQTPLRELLEQVHSPAPAAQIDPLFDFAADWISEQEHF